MPLIKPLNKDVLLLVSDEILEIAIEHLAWEIQRGSTASDVLACLGRPVPSPVNWEDVLGALAENYDLGAEIRSRRDRQAKARAA